jgi:hypothetical protein
MTMRRKHWLTAGMFAMATAGVAILRSFDPATSGIFPPCPVRYMFGWYCPGCGSLRAMHQLLLGNLRAAWALNPLTILLLPFLTYGMASEIVFQIRGQHLLQVRLPAAWIRALCTAIILFGIVRNIPLYPFTLLAPGGARPN